MFILLCFDLLVSNYCETLGGIIKLSRDLPTQTQHNDGVVKTIEISFWPFGDTMMQ